MNEGTIRKNIDESMIRINLIADPEYIVGEDKNVHCYLSWMNRCNNLMMGSVVLGQIGNGKTHFLRYMRKKVEENETAVGIYMPDMFFNGPLVDALNSLYASLFKSNVNKDLSTYLEDWEQSDKSLANRYVDNNIVRYLTHCNNTDEKRLVLDYFSNKDLFPDQVSFMRKKFNAKKRFINNENDFVTAFVAALQFIQCVTGKKILLFIDEIDKVYSDSTNSISLTKVGYKILTSYRTLFDYLNNCKVEGMITVGTTIEAWEVLSHQAAFERRFKDHQVVLKTPKTKEEVMEFIIKRFQENNVNVENADKKDIEKYVSYLTENDMKSWANIISALLKGKNSDSMNKTIEPEEIILDVLSKSLVPLSWEEMLESSDALAAIYPKAQPIKTLQSMNKRGKIIINEGKPNTYEISE